MTREKIELANKLVSAIDNCQKYLAAMDNSDMVTLSVMGTLKNPAVSMQIFDDIYTDLRNNIKTIIFDEIDKLNKKLENL